MRHMILTAITLGAFAASPVAQSQTLTSVDLSLAPESLLVDTTTTGAINPGISFERNDLIMPGMLSLTRRTVHLVVPQ